MNFLRDTFVRAFKDGSGGIVDTICFTNMAARITGWSLCLAESPPRPPRAVVVVIEDRVLGIVTEFTPRPDLCEHFELDASPFSGFVCDIRMESQCEPGSIFVYALSQSGYFYKLDFSFSAHNSTASSFLGSRFPFPGGGGGRSHIFPILNCEDRRQKILSIVACPDCRGHLERTGERLCCKCGRSFKFDDHVPLFLASENAGYVGPEGTTNPYSPKALQLIGKYPQSLILDFGAGNPAPSEQFANVVREDFCKSPSTDIVVQTPNLPFRDEVFDHIISESVFEHVSDPLHYARELHRVLKKDGFVVIDTAFMQPVHMEFNYYNMTLDGLKETFKMFDIVESGVEPYQSASQALNIMVRTYKGLIDNASANRELSMLSSIDFAEYDQFIPADKQKLCSAGVYIIAQKR